MKKNLVFTLIVALTVVCVGVAHSGMEKREESPFKVTETKSEYSAMIDEYMADIHDEWVNNLEEMGF